MKRLLPFFFLTLPLAAPACDICGCGPGSSFVGILPQAGRGFAGLRYRIKSYDSHLSSRFLKTRETFQTAELWARWYPLNRVQILAFVPVQFNRQQTAGDVYHRNGLGDVTVLAHYNLVNTALDTVPRRVNHNLLVGLGVKAPTGKFRYVADGTEVANPNFQLGTGSTDPLLSTIYTLRAGTWGWNTDATLRLTTRNADGYRFGNRATASSSLFFVKNGASLTWMPNAGVTLETAARDRDHGTPNANTGGYLTLGTLGLEAYTKRLSMGLNWQTPLAQYLAGGELRSRNRAMGHVTVLF
jgi:hypothetical protein